MDPQEFRACFPRADGLEVKDRCQEAPHWCWAASVEILTDYHGARVSQCQQATDAAMAEQPGAAPEGCCEEPMVSRCFRDDVLSLPSCGQPRTPELQRYGFSCVFTRRLTWDEVRSEIGGAGRPFLVALRTAAPVGQMLVTVGYGREDDGRPYIELVDPHVVTPPRHRRLAFDESAFSYAVTGIVRAAALASCHIPAHLAD